MCVCDRNDRAEVSECVSDYWRIMYFTFIRQLNIFNIKPHIMTLCLLTVCVAPFSHFLILSRSSRPLAQLELRSPELSAFLRCEDADWSLICHLLGYTLWHMCLNNFFEATKIWHKFNTPGLAITWLGIISLLSQIKCVFGQYMLIKSGFLKCRDKNILVLKGSMKPDSGQTGL